MPCISYGTLKTLWPELVRERKREEKVVGGSERQHLKGGEEIFPPVLKAPRQCPLVLLVKVCLREGEALES
jgi:hypothetical protein